MVSILNNKRGQVAEGAIPWKKPQYPQEDSSKRSGITDTWVFTPINWAFAIFGWVGKNLFSLLLIICIVLFIYTFRMIFVETWSSSINLMASGAAAVLTMASTVNQNIELIRQGVFVPVETVAKTPYGLTFDEVTVSDTTPRVGQQSVLNARLKGNARGGEGCARVSASIEEGQIASIYPSSCIALSAIKTTPIVIKYIAKENTKTMTDTTPLNLEAVYDFWAKGSMVISVADAQAYDQIASTYIDAPDQEKAIAQYFNVQPEATLISSNTPLQIAAKVPPMPIKKGDPNTFLIINLQNNGDCYVKLQSVTITGEGFSIPECLEIQNKPPYVVNLGKSIAYKLTKDHLAEESEMPPGTVKAYNCRLDTSPLEIPDSTNTETRNIVIDATYTCTIRRTEYVKRPNCLVTNSCPPDAVEQAVKTGSEVKEKIQGGVADAKEGVEEVVG